MKLSHAQVNDRYEQLRQNSRTRAQNALPVELKNRVYLGRIDARSLARAKLWTESSQRKVTWDWSWGYEIYRKRYPKRFELTVWQQNTLCGMSLGRPSYQGSKLRLDFAERAPENCPLRGYVMQLIILSAEAYALNIGAQEVRLMHPMNKELVNFYSRFGYSFVEGGSELGTVNDRKPSFLYKSV